MSGHIVTTKDFVGFRPRTRLCGHHAKGTNKAVDIVTEATTKRVWYEVSNNKEVVFAGPELEEALYLYNKIG